MTDEEVAGGGVGGGGSDGGGRAAVPSLANRLGFEQTHPAGTTALVALFALLLGRYAGWLLADFGLRWLGFFVITAIASYGLYSQPTARSVVVRGLYSLAVLVALTPVAIDATFLAASLKVAGVGNPWAFVFTVADLVYLAVFAILAAILAGIGWLLSRRG